jgi:hypothetical protein
MLVVDSLKLAQDNLPMESDQPLQDPSQLTAESAAGQEAAEAAASARALVDQMVAAGEWPDPALLEQILAAGDAAVAPLLEVLKTRPRGWPEEAPLSHALGLVSMIRPPEALPLLVELGRYYKDETGEEVGDTLAAFGTVGFEKLLELVRQPSVRGFHRLDLIGSAVAAAGDDVVLKSRVAETVREILDQAMIQYRSFTQRFRENPETLEPKTLLRDPDEVYPTDELGFLISHLSDLADPLALEMIAAAFEENLVSLEIINRENVKSLYAEGGLVQKAKPNWLDDYREYYAERDEPEAKVELEPRASDRFTFPSRASYPALERESPQAPARPVQPVVTIRNTTPKIGRNDPCWCGSGKKYKKCHLGTDDRS